MLEILHTLTCWLSKSKDSPTKKIVSKFIFFAIITLIGFGLFRVAKGLLSSTASAPEQSEPAINAPLPSKPVVKRDAISQNKALVHHHSDQFKNHTTTANDPKIKQTIQDAAVHMESMFEELGLESKAIYRFINEVGKQASTGRLDEPKLRQLVNDLLKDTGANETVSEKFYEEFVQAIQKTHKEMTKTIVYKENALNHNQNFSREDARLGECIVDTVRPLLEKYEGQKLLNSEVSNYSSALVKNCNLTKDEAFMILTKAFTQ